jgi:hypothetical protein
MSLKVPGSLPKCCLWKSMTVKFVVMVRASSTCAVSARRATDTDRKSLLALRGVGPESEAESVRLHGRRVTKVGPGSQTRAFSIGLSLSIARCNFPRNPTLPRGSHMGRWHAHPAAPCRRWREPPPRRVFETTIRASSNDFFLWDFIWRRTSPLVQDFSES